MHGTTVKKTY